MEFPNFRAECGAGLSCARRMLLLCFDKRMLREDCGEDRKR